MTLTADIDSIIGYRNRRGLMAVSLDDGALILPTGRTVPNGQAWEEMDDEVDAADLSEDQVRVLNAMADIEARQLASAQARRELEAAEKLAAEEDILILAAMWCLSDTKSPTEAVRLHPKGCLLVKRDPAHAEAVWRGDKEERAFRRDMRDLNRFARSLGLKGLTI